MLTAVFLNSSIWFDKIKLGMPKNYNAEVNNPCLKEQPLSYKCLEQNHFDGKKCELFFANYNNCKEFWSKVRSDRRSKSIFPVIPVVAERADIKAKYMRSKPT